MNGAPTPSLADAGGRRILVADDNEDIRRDVARVLGPRGRRESLAARASELLPELGLETARPQDASTRPFGPVSFEVETASSGEEALSRARAARGAGQPIAVAFVDVRMPPGMDGARVARLLRDEDPDIEVVLITAYADRTVGELNAGTAGCDRLLFLKKPYAREELYQLALSLTEKRAHRRSLREARERLDLVLGATRDGLVGIDQDHRVTFANRAARELLGIRDDASRTEELWRELATTANPRIVAGGAIELHRAGRWVELSEVTRPTVLDPNVRGVLAVRDVTARKEVERLKDEFVQNTSHELRTPLVAVRGYLDLALEDRLGPLSPSLRRGLEVARRASGRLLDLIDALLELARLEAAEDAAIERHPLDLHQVIEHAVEVVRPAAVAKGLELEVSVSVRPAVALGDPRTLEVAIRNLLGNAIKFTERGRVGVAAHAGGRGIVVEIWDTGPGLPAHVAPELLFERFRQGDGSASRAKGGVGIGLSLVERILALHGSRATARNRPEGGASFRFELERAERAAVAAEPAPAPAGGTALVVDRSGTTRAFVALVLRGADYAVHEAASATEAIERIAQGRHDLVLVEHELADELRAHAATNGARVAELVRPSTPATAPGAASIEKPICVRTALAAATPASATNGLASAAALPGRAPRRAQGDEAA